jgi:hypothetical protein
MLRDKYACGGRCEFFVTLLLPLSLNRISVAWYPRMPIYTFLETQLEQTENVIFASCIWQPWTQSRLIPCSFGAKTLSASYDREILNRDMFLRRCHKFSQASTQLSSHLARLSIEILRHIRAGIGLFCLALVRF